MVEHGYGPQAGPPAGYSGSSRSPLGLSTPLMRGFLKEWVAGHRDLSYEDWRATLESLYLGQRLEEPVFAGLLLGAYQAHRTALPLPQLRAWIAGLEGWLEVDTSCQNNFTAREVLAAWDRWEPFLRGLAVDEQISCRRAALVLLLRPLRESADPRLIELGLAQVETLKGERDKLITKAISWLLRAGIKHQRARIEAYATANEDSLPRHALRELRLKLATGKRS